MKEADRKISRLNEREARKVKELYNAGLSARKISAILNIPETTLWRIIKGEYEAKPTKRCKKCGRLIETEECLYCKIEPIGEETEGLESKEEEIEEGENLKGGALKRYLEIKKRKEKEADEKAKERLKILEGVCKNGKKSKSNERNI